ncbi:glycosyltransferase [Microbacterium paraoxydans]|uniref:glycosyltransferase n=1 Tax=Microbacterium paraoxydans TaxID=199592 RepID=UPI002285882E|nr:glycosyltransferase [Microbacterium paraoxydans]MCZ0709103.1 glycosyltransferase [Microbacterium paraoxydans]
MIVATRLYTPEVTAASFRMEALVQAMTTSADVTVLTTRPPAGSVARAEDTAARIKRMPVLRDRSGAIRGYVQYLSFDIPLFFRLLVNRADVIVAEAPPTTGLVAAVAGMLTRRPVVYYPGDVWSDAVASTEAPGLVVRLMTAVERFVLRRSARSIAVSAEVAERLVAVGALPERVVEVGNGIDTDVFRPDVSPAAAERPYFVYTGTMSEWQQPDVFVRALAELDDVDVDIRFFGQGSVEAELKALADTLVPGRVHFGGLVPPAGSASWIRGAVGALVSIVPGIGYDFARPTKTYAAAAVGTPVLFAGAQTGAEVVRAAGLGEASDFTVSEVAQAMRRLVAQAQDGTTEHERPRRAQWAVDTVSWSTVGGKAADVVRSVLDGLRGRRR